ncbi:MAG: hypothetical protein H0T73_01770 [Ardenticatenales bacterium]|nr:hypothetical protein [Ardenticatenales bacterium]
MALSKDELERLYYNEQLSMQQIATHYRCSLNKIVYWMEKYGFERRSASEATYLHKNPDGDPFLIKMPDTPEGWKLFGVGIGIYMGEGTKQGGQLAVSNSNPGILQAFLLFLEKICGVSRSDIRADLNIFDDCDAEGAVSWWAHKLGLEVEQFYPPTTREGKKGSYKKKSRYGTLSIRYYNTKLLNIINSWCHEYFEELNNT